MFKIAAIGLSVAWKTGLLVGASLAIGGAMVEVAHAVGRRKNGNGHGVTSSATAAAR
jgi:hypothetical protein